MPRLHETLASVARKLKDTRGLRCELVYVDDGSSDKTFAVASALPASGVDVQVISLSRNFGKEAALLAGLEHARHGAVLFIDGDGQHPPGLIDKLVGHWLDDGYDVVYTAKAHRENESGCAPVRRESILHADELPRAPQNSGGCRRFPPAVAARRRSLAADAGAQPVSSKALRAGSASSRSASITSRPSARTARPAGIMPSLIGLSIEGLTSFSVAPLRLASLLGLVLALVALIFGAAILYETVIYGKSVPGYPSLVVGLMVLGGVQLIMIGIVGEYIGKILSEQKARPVYFVAEQNLKTAESERKDAAE